MIPRAPRAFGLAAAAVALALATAAVPSASAEPAGSSPPAPSAAQVAAARAQAAERAGQVKAVEQQIARSQQRLAALNAAAEKVIEAYDAAQVRLGQAQTAAAGAQTAAQAAVTQLGSAQRQVDRYAAAAYMSGGGLDSLNSFAGSSGPASLMDRVLLMDSISLGQQRALNLLAASKVYAHVVEQRARRELAVERAAFAVAVAARARALAQVQAQVAVLHGLQSQQRRLATLLAQAAAHANLLAHQRNVALAEMRARQIAAERAAAAAARAAAAAAASAASGQGTSTPVAPATTAPVGNPAAVAVQWAYAELGKPYVWGAAGPDTFDCSGLTQFAYAKAGIMLLHYTGYQWNEGAHVAFANLLPGDLVFYAYNTADPSTIHHVGIYIGNGEMIDAPHTGAFVEIDPVLEPGYIGAVRPY